MKKVAALFSILLYSFYTFACTTFLLSKNGEHVFGRNYDWVTSSGMVMINAKGIKKTSIPVGDGNTITWTAACGSITFNQYGKEFPTGGMNEKGLVVELMWLDETRYPSKDDRAAMGTLQWIQYQLDNSATVEEVIASNKKIRISNYGASVPLQYLVADAAGNAATIEFIDGKMIVHKSKDLAYPVLTNTVYKDAITAVGNSIEKNEVQNFNNNSLYRFAKACSKVQQFQKVNEQPVTYAFDLLKDVSQGNFTVWSIVYDISNKQIHFKTADNKAQRTLSFKNFDFSCDQPPLAYNMSQSLKGEIDNHFKPFTTEINKWLVQKSAQESISRINISQTSINETVDYFTKNICNK